ncbi:stonustoxin subunit beta-like [Thunnus albacares]|uniref:stonustoxin subunit beta-like n=1 Tax=Thunnus albacares TaxID=8236 RepID=UPI001CF6167A|nr:stonustoxin subunit beta-like [Thunnus albacares]
MSEEFLKVAALGRPFTLGMLYDARQDELIPGFTLWDKTTLQENTTETSNPSSEFQITACDSIESKSTLLEVDASLKASFLGRLIEVGGSAKYLYDQKKFKNQSRVTFQYKATTNFKQLSLTLGTMDTQQTDVIEKGLATHVVTGILYGANAFFVFDSEKLDASSVENIQGSMEAVIKKIPSFDIEGKVDIKLTEEEEDLTKKFSCKFYGDLLLESNPATFVDAVKTYVELPKLLGEKGEHAAPLKVWLMPLKNLDSKAAELMSDISVGVVRKAEDALEGIREIKMRCNDSLEDKVSEDFPEIRKTLSTFQKLCNNFTSALQQTMKKTFPSIREGEEDESSLKKLFEDRDKSPFSQDKLSKWMDHKEREITVIRSCVDMMEGTNTKIVKNQSELDREIFDPDVKNTLCFVFTSVESVDPCLDAMADYLDSPEIRSTNEDHWYFSDEVLMRMREKAKAFHDLAESLKESSSVCFLVTATANEKYKGATIYHYKEGKLVTDDFSKPDVPSDVETITDKSALIWYACDLSLDPNTVNYDLILSDNDKKVTHGARQEYPDHPGRFDICPQVLCREGLTGRHYWEIEWSDGYNEDKAVGVTYKQIDRKGDSILCFLGGSDNSWCFGGNTMKPELFAGHCDQWWRGSIPCTGCKRVGVYLDWPAGTLSFYNVSSNTLSHIKTFNARFNKPVYPGCYIYSQSGSVFFCPVE